MAFSDMFYIVAAAFLVWYWLDGMRCKEIAHYAGKAACQEAEVLFLDDSVTIRKTRLRRNGLGRIVLYREYNFEFTSDGNMRSHGEVHILGKRIIETTMDAYRI